MTEASPTGRQFTISHGDQQAVITERGAGLRSYSVGDRDMVVPFGEGELPPAMHGAILLPWPNRLGDGRYEFDGLVHQLPVNEPARRVANHGFAHTEPWQLHEHSASHVELAIRLAPRPGYPFRLTVHVHYALDDNGLTVRLAALNAGEDRAPYGVGFHPWLSPGGARVDDCRLEVDAKAWIRTDERLLPVETGPIPPEKDFRSPRSLADTSLDDGYAEAFYRHPEATDQDHRSWVRLMAPDATVAAAWMQRPLGYWQVCTGDFPETGRYERTGVAAEPMSCPANAFVTGENLALIEPGATHTVIWGLCLLREGDEPVGDATA